MNARAGGLRNTDHSASGSSLCSSKFADRNEAGFQVQLGPSALLKN